MFNAREVAEDLLNNNLEVIDLINNVEFLESIDRILIEAYKNNDDFGSPYNLNKIAKIRRQLIGKIGELKSKEIDIAE